MRRFFRGLWITLVFATVMLVFGFHIWAIIIGFDFTEEYDYNRAVEIMTKRIGDNLPIKLENILYSDLDEQIFRIQ